MNCFKIFIMPICLFFVYSCNVKKCEQAADKPFKNMPVRYYLPQISQIEKYLKTISGIGLSEEKECIDGLNYYSFNEKLESDNYVRLKGKIRKDTNAIYIKTDYGEQVLFNFDDSIRSITQIKYSNNKNDYDELKFMGKCFYSRINDTIYGYFIINNLLDLESSEHASSIGPYQLYISKDAGIVGVKGSVGGVRLFTIVYLPKLQIEFPSGENLLPDSLFWQ